MLKQMNKKLNPIRVVVEEGNAMVRTHGASGPGVEIAVKEIIDNMKTGELSVSPGVYSIEITRTRLFRYEYNLVKV